MVCNDHTHKIVRLKTTYETFININNYRIFISFPVINYPYQQRRLLPGSQENGDMHSPAIVSAAY